MECEDNQKAKKHGTSHYCHLIRCQLIDHQFRFNFLSNYIAKHGKDIADGDGQALGGMVKGSFKDDYGLGSQSLVRHLAHKHPRPKTERHTIYFGTKGFYATTPYVYMFMVEDGMDEIVVATDDGYKDSSKDHYYQSRGFTENSERLHWRLRV